MMGAMGLAMGAMVRGTMVRGTMMGRMVVRVLVPMHSSVMMGNMLLVLGVRVVLGVVVRSVLVAAIGVVRSMRSGGGT